MLKGRRRKRMWYSGSRETAWKLRVCCFSHDSCWGQLASKFSQLANDELTISSDLRCFISLYILRRRYISIHRCLIIIHLLRTWGRLFASVQTARTTTAVPFFIFLHLFSITLCYEAWNVSSELWWRRGSDLLIFQYAGEWWNDYAQLEFDSMKHACKHVHQNAWTCYKNALNYQIDGFQMFPRFPANPAVGPTESSVLQEDLQLPFSTRGLWSLLEIRSCSRSCDTIEEQYDNRIT